MNTSIAMHRPSVRTEIRSARPALARALSLLLPVLAGLLPPGCSLLPDREPPHLRAETLDHTLVPENLDQPGFVEHMTVPEVTDIRGLAGQRVRVFPPDPISTGAEVDQIVIRRLGEDNWVFVDLPPAMVWPKVLAFWSTRDLGVLSADAGLGLLDTIPATGRGANAEALWESLALTGQGPGYQFRVRIEPGVRSGSSEIRLLERRTSNPVASWSATSEDIELEYLVLSRLAYYLGEVVNQHPEVSAGALQLAGADRAVLVPDREQPVLRYKLDFDRAWATVGNALEAADIQVFDLDRSRAVYYVSLDEGTGRGGLFGRKRKRKERDEAAARLQVRLQAKGGEVHVTVSQETPGPEALAKAERLLKIIKEYST